MARWIHPSPDINPSTSCRSWLPVPLEVMKQTLPEQCLPPGTGCRGADVHPIPRATVDHNPGLWEAFTAPGK